MGKETGFAILGVVEGESLRLASTVGCPSCYSPVKPIVLDAQNGLQRPPRTKNWLIEVRCPACRSHFQVDADSINIADD